MKLNSVRKLLVIISCSGLFICLLVILNCSSSRDNENDLITIDLKNLIQNECEVPISQFVENLEYTLLELTPESGIFFIKKIYATDEYFIVFNSSPGSANHLLLFDRRSGKYIREVGERGIGPEEYARPLDCFFNSFDNKIYAYGSMRSSVKNYNLEGNFIESFVTPGYNETSVNGYLPIDAFLDSVSYIGYIENSTGQVSKRVVIFSKDKEIMNFPHYEKWTSDGSGNQYISIEEPVFFSWGNEVSFKERSNDTIFKVTKNKLIPRLVLYSGNLRCPYKLSREEAVEQLTKPKDYFEALNIFESSGYLFFDLASKNNPIEGKPASFKLIRNLCVFDKTTKKAYACKNNYETINSCLTDDLNNFMPIAPISITGNNELVAVLQAIEIKKWITDNPQGFSELRKKMPWLVNITEIDNPVIVTAKLKK
jgi:hypothetical protein